ncbi:MAG: type I restriction enzyme, R subunit [bacterium F083]|nr:MAG: type I restriction enzyme, R subunit [bacterium F083]
MLETAGWRVVDRSDFVSNEALAVRESIMIGNKEADYMLFLMGKAVGVLEAKREEIDVNQPKVAEQAENYTRLLPSWCQSYQTPLPFVWLSNGKDAYFRDIRNEESEYDKVDKILSPKEVVKLLGITEPYAGLPMLQQRGLRECQYEGLSVIGNIHYLVA